MELAQLHTFEPRSTAWVEAQLQELLRPGWLHRRAALGVAIHGPWRPADVWPASLERLAWTTSLEERGPVLSEAGELGVGALGMIRRKAPVHLVEALAVRAGEGLVIVHSDVHCLAYVAVYRDRRLKWSLLLQDRVRLVRCDGEQVMVAEPPRFVPEGDRTGVLLAGIEHWIREPIALPSADRFVLPDLLAQLGGDEPNWIVRDGAFLSGTPDRQRARASG